MSFLYDSMISFNCPVPQIRSVYVDGLRHFSHSFHKFPINFHSIKCSSRSKHNVLGRFHFNRHVNVIAFHSNAHHIRYIFRIERAPGRQNWVLRTTNEQYRRKDSFISIWSMEAAASPLKIMETHFFG